MTISRVKFPWPPFFRIFIFFDEVFNLARGTTYLMRDDGATVVNVRPLAALAAGRFRTCRHGRCERCRMSAPLLIFVSLPQLCLAAALHSRLRDAEVRVRRSACGRAAARHPVVG